MNEPTLPELPKMDSVREVAPLACGSAKGDKPLCTTPLRVAQCERLAIRMYRHTYRLGPLWQELDNSTRTMWVVHAERSAK